MEPKKLEVSPSDGTISISWSDGHIARYTPFKLRTECPCAMCNGEPGVFGKYYAIERPKINPAVQAEEIESVGRYGLKIVWSDKHDLGIYTFEYLRELCECRECDAKRKELEEGKSD
jgi:DUF971 family protein